MKELSIEKKAKRYDKAIERVEGLIDFCSDSELKTLEYVFPELKESEDDKIRKEIINYFKCQSREEPSRKDTHNKWIAWLEKQGEQKSAWSENDSPYYDDICEILINLLHSETADVNKDAVQKDLDWFISLRPQPKQKNNDDYITPSKKFFQWIYDRLVYVHKENPDIDYMRSFKERIENLSFDETPHWKPSKEQIDVLEAVVGMIHPSDTRYDAVFGLLDELKAL